MDRKIKFRVWSKSLDRFLTKEEYCLDFDGKLMFIEIDYGGFTDLVLVDPSLYVVQQYTGIKDKNGKEIFEGDIIFYEHLGRVVTAPVVFSPLNFGFVLDSSGRHRIGDFKYGDYIPLLASIVRADAVTYTVIGNIFENPELRK